MPAAFACGHARQANKRKHGHVPETSDSDNPVATHLCCSRAAGRIGAGESFYFCDGNRVPRRILAVASGDRLAGGRAVGTAAAGSGAVETVHRQCYDFHGHYGGLCRVQQGQFQAVRDQDGVCLHDRVLH